MKTRVVTNWKSSLLGIVLLIISVVMLWLRVITGGEFIALLPTTLGLLYVPDSVFRKCRRARVRPERRELKIKN